MGFFWIVLGSFGYFCERLKQGPVYRGVCNGVVTKLAKNQIKNPDKNISGSNQKFPNDFQAQNCVKRLFGRVSRYVSGG